MAYSKYHSKVDANQSLVVQQFRELGCSVRTLHTIGGGFPDIIVGKGGVNVLIEIKDGNKPASLRKLTDDEAVFHEEWRGWVAIVENFTDVLNVVQTIVPRATNRG